LLLFLSIHIVQFNQFMKRKALAVIATFIVLAGTTLLPASTFFVSTFGAQTAHAQVTPSTGVTDPNATTYYGPGGDPSGSGAGQEPTTQAQANAAGTGGTAPDGSNQQQPTPPTQNVGGFACDFTDVLCGLVKFANFLLTSITGLIANVAAIILDFSIKFSISSSTYSNDAVNSIVVSGWKLIRDFSTIFLMFALFVVAFMLIFNSEGSEGSWAAHFSPGRTIARVIIIALLVNFSFFLCRSVIEIGNVFALVLYDKIDQGNQSVQNYSTNSVANEITAYGSSAFAGTPFANVKSISVGVLSNINPQRVLLSTHKTGSGNDTTFLIDYLFMSFIVAIINLLLIFVFTSMFILFIGRVIGLYLGIILSPFAFVSWTIPFLSNMPYIGFDNWLKELMGFTFLGPVYLLFVYLTVAFMKIPNPTSNSNLFALSAFAIIDSLLCLFVLMKGKKIAESMAGEFGQMVAKGANFLAVAGVGLATGGTGLLASNTIGRLGAAVATNGTIKRIADGGPSQDVESVQQRMKMASGIRNIGIGKYNLGRTQFGQRLASKVQQGDLSMGALKANAAQGVRTMGKGLRTVNPLDASVFGGTLRKGTAAIATATGNQNLATGLAKNYASTIKDQMVKSRAIDIQAISNAKKTITNVSNDAVSAGIASAFAGTAPASGTGGSASGAAATAATSTTMGTGGGSTNGASATAATGQNNRSASDPDSNVPPPPPTGGATPATNNQPPQTGTQTAPAKPVVLPARQSQQATAAAGGGADFTRSRNLFTGNVDFDRPKTAPSAPATTRTFGDGSAQAPVYTPQQQERILNKAIAAQEKSQNRTVSQPVSVNSYKPTPTTESASKASGFLSTIQGSGTETPSEAPKIITEPKPAAPSSKPIITTSAPSYQSTGPIIVNRAAPQPVAQPQIILQQTAAQPVANPQIITTQAAPARQEAPRVVTQPAPQIQVPTPPSRTQQTISQASTLSGATNRNVQDVGANQKIFEQKNMGIIGQASAQSQISPLVEAKKAEIQKIEADRKEFLQDVNSHIQQNGYQSVSNERAIRTIDEYDTKKKKAYDELKSLQSTPTSGSSDQSGLISGNLPGDFGGMQLPGRE
ncbi:MAG: seg, partial [Patescibacteria group bacterium]|nr:seg [Patescibacteria group bacterium]